MSVSNTVIRVSAKVFVKVKEYLATGRKIQAIKIIRSEANCGLKEAKQAVDRMQDPSLSGPKIVTIPCIKSIIVDIGSGDIKMDLEQFNMFTLMEMQSIGIEDTRKLLDLYDLFREWEGAHENQKSDE